MGTYTFLDATGGSQTGTANANGRAGAASGAPITLSTEDLAALTSIHDAITGGSTTAIPAGTNTIGGVVIKPSAVASGETASRVNAASTTNATSLKASAGNIYAIDVFNTSAYTIFLKLYDKASAPTVGTDTPIWTIPIPAGAGFSRSFERGRGFATGIAYAITKLQADSDTTAVVAGDATGSISWM